MSVTAYGNPETIEKTCEWTGQKFIVDWKHRNQRFINIQAMYEWRKSQSHESVPCKHCGKMFSRRKRLRHWKSGNPQQYCSSICATKSIEHIEAAKKWTEENQPMRSKESRLQISKTKFEKYGDSKYNNPKKNLETCMSKYGVPYTTHLPQVISNGHRISKFQKRIYEQVLKTYPDARLEEYLEDAHKSVDIYIPSQRRIIECYGDYWHCNPKIYSPSYYNKSLKMTSSEKWKVDAIRISQLISMGYTVEIFWESD